MKTLTLHIADNIFEEVKTFLSLFSPEKIQIKDNPKTNIVFSAGYLNSIEVTKMKKFFEKFNIPIPKNMNKIPVVYNEDDLKTDIENLKKIKLLK